MNPARITEIAFAPTAGANGVDPLDPAPIAQAMNMLATPATTSVAIVATPTILSAGIRPCYKCLLFGSGRGVAADESVPVTANVDPTFGLFGPYT
jgi:hypothetical protein